MTATCFNTVSDATKGMLPVEHVVAPTNHLCMSV